MRTGCGARLETSSEDPPGADLLGPRGMEEGSPNGSPRTGPEAQAGEEFSAAAQSVVTESARAQSYRCF